MALSKQNGHDAQEEKDTYLDANALEQHDIEMEDAVSTNSYSPTYHHATSKFRNASTASIFTPHPSYNNDNVDMDIESDLDKLGYGQLQFQQKQHNNHHHHHNHNNQYNQHYNNNNNHNHHHHNNGNPQNNKKKRQTQTQTNLNQTYNGSGHQITNNSYFGTVHQVLPSPQPPKTAKKDKISKKYGRTAVKCIPCKTEINIVNANQYIDCAILNNHHSGKHGNANFEISCQFPNCEWSIIWDKSQEVIRETKDHRYAHKMMEQINRL